MNPYSAHCDDFSANIAITTKMDLPSGRETVLHLMEAVQRVFPGMTEFDRRESGEYSLEEERDGGSYRWFTVEPRRVSAGFVNPECLEVADVLLSRVLDLAPAHLDMCALDCDFMDVALAFDLEYSGNHDAVVADALAVGSPLENFLQYPDAKPVHFEPAYNMALDEGCRLQARLNIETRTTPYQVRTGQYPEAPISVYFTVRQFFGKAPHLTFMESFQNQRRICQELVETLVIPHVIQPLARAIGAKQ